LRGNVFSRGIVLLVASVKSFLCAKGCESRICRFPAATVAAKSCRSVEECGRGRNGFGHRYTKLAAGRFVANGPGNKGGGVGKSTAAGQFAAVLSRKYSKEKLLFGGGRHPSTQMGRCAVHAGFRTRNAITDAARCDRPLDATLLRQLCLIPRQRTATVLAAADGSVGNRSEILMKRK